MTNVGYFVVAIFITQHEDIDSIAEVLTLLKNSNEGWEPRNTMTDFSLAEIGAIEKCFPSKKSFSLPKTF